MYFFVQSGNTELAERVERGLQLSQKDGSFDKLFNSIPRLKWAMAELERGGRTLLQLKTPEQK